MVERVGGGDGRKIGSLPVLNDPPPDLQQTTPPVDMEQVEACLRMIAPDVEIPPNRPPAAIVDTVLPKIAAQSWSSADTEDYVPVKAPKIKRLGERARLRIRKALARKVYRPGLEKGRGLLDHLGKMARKYITATEPDDYNRKWMALEELHKTGHFGGAFGHAVGDGTPEVMSKLIASRSELQQLDKQTKRVGRDLTLPSGETIPVKQAEVSLMMGVSGMSFPQLSAPSILSLLYTHVRMAKDGVRYLLNTGEGGPNFHLALLEGDEEALRREVVAWGVKTGELEEGSIDHAKVEEFIHDLMRDRAALFEGLDEEDIGKAQIVAQFGTALNGIRGEHDRIDFNKLAKIGQNRHVAMVEYKLKQAAKRGSRVDVSKMDEIAAAMREVNKGERFKSPAINPEMESYEDIAKLVIATKLTTKKPVSLKFAVGDVENIYEFLEYLARMDALPDNIQLDGAGKTISPGSGNMPPTGAAGNSSLGAREATLVVDAILEHLGVRNEVNLTAAGEVMMPTDALEEMALGADGAMGARTWMNMGLGCAKVGACNTGNCPYGIASASGSVFAAGMDPKVVAERAYNAATEWRDHLLISMTETGSMDWRSFRKTHGLHARKTSIRIKEGDQRVSLRKAYGKDRAKDLLGEVMRDEEIDEAVYDRRPAEYQAYEYFDASRRLVKFLDANLDPGKPEEAAAFKRTRLQELEAFLEIERSGPELRDFIRDVPDDLLMPGVRVLGPKTRHPRLQVINGGGRRRGS